MARNIEDFTRAWTDRPLRPHQLEPARAVVHSVTHRQGRTFTVMMARQMGKNELSAQLEAYLLYVYRRRGGTIVKAAPTFKPQLINSKMRLERVLAGLPAGLKWESHYGYIVTLGAAAIHFLSADDGASVVGATASLLLELDEAQDVGEEKYLKDFRPMGSTANVTTVLYGTAWNEDTILARQRAINLREHPAAHFEYPWTALAEANQDYARFVQGEIRRLGEDHPIIRTQYLLQPVDAVGRFLSADQLLLLRGDHPRLHEPPLEAAGSALFVAGVDLAGEDEEAPDAAIRQRHPGRDSTVVTVARVHYPAELLGDPLLSVVQHYCWTGRDQASQYQGLLRLLRDVWAVRAVAVDGSGVGAGVAGWLHRALPGRVDVVRFTRPLKSDLGYALLSAINGGRLRMYAADESEEASQFWSQARLARYATFGNLALNFFVDPRDGHDDFLVSLALCLRAAAALEPAPAGQLLRAPRLYRDGRF
ncbi:MAG TPA: hypothetical protein VMV93_12770 [Chloroflexota bacterium]|nr:hypothetical protein [Chloroflexota bacterium]